MSRTLSALKNIFYLSHRIFYMGIKNQLGYTIKAFRKQNNLTQEKLAELIDISTHAISSIERGINSPNIKNLEKISKILKIPLSEFYKNIDDTKHLTDKKQNLINSIIGILYKLTERELQILLKQTKAFEKEE